MQATEKLKGKELLERVSGMINDGFTPREVARQLGYTGKDDKVYLTQFYQDLLKARGVMLEQPKEDGRGRDATYRVSVHKNGQIVIGAAYTQAMGLNPGEEFDIKLGYKHIKLVKVEDEQ